MKRRNLMIPIVLSVILVMTPGTGYSSGQTEHGDSPAPTYESSYPAEGLNTNFRASFGFSPGSADPDDTPWYKPSADDFQIMRTDCCSPTDQEILDYIYLCEHVGSQKYKVRFINRLDQVTVDGTDPRVQIVSNHVILEDPVALTGGYATFTLYFPPYFKITPDSRHPILLFGSGWSGGLNELVLNGKTYIADTVNKAYDELDPLKKGVIAVTTNCGGNGSVGYTRWFLRDVARMIDLLHREYSGDRSRIITIGSSRGGAISLIVAENPYEGDPDFPPYNVVGVFSRTFPVSAGTKSQLPLCLMPTYTSFYSAELGPGSGRYDNDPPPMISPAPVLEAPMDTTDVLEADNVSADGQWLSKLQGKFIALQFGSHDSWMGRQSFLHTDRKLSLLGISHVSIVVLTPGHNIPAETGHFNEIASEFMEALLTDPDFDPQTFKTQYAKGGVFEMARNYYVRRDNRIDHLTQWSSLAYLKDQESLPFMATIPYRMGRKVRDDMPWHEPGGIELSGTIGRKWQVIIRDDTGTEVATYSGVFGFGPPRQGGHAETTIIQWGYEGLPNIDSAMYYSYQFFYEDQRGEMVDVSYFTNFSAETFPGSGVYMRLAPKTTILEYQPYITQYLVSAEMMAFGIDWCETLLFHRENP